MTMRDSPYRQRSAFGVSKRQHLRGMCGAQFDLQSNLLLTGINTFKCLYLIELFDDLLSLLLASGAGEGIEAPLLIHHLNSDKHFSQFLLFFFIDKDAHQAQNQRVCL